MEQDLLTLKLEATDNKIIVTVLIMKTCFQACKHSGPVTFNAYFLKKKLLKALLQQNKK